MPKTVYAAPTQPTRVLAECRADFRLNQVGPQALSLTELLTIVMGKGTADPGMYRKAQELLNATGDPTLGPRQPLTAIANMTPDEMQALGVTETERARILAALELGRRHITVQPKARLQIRRPTDIANLLLLEMGTLEQEELRVAILDTKLYIKRIVTVYKGNLNSAIVRIGEIFRDAIRHNAASIVIVHNHPSGDPSPSIEDIRMTKLVIDAGKLNDIEVLDHIVIGKHKFVSMKERGLGGFY